MRVQFRDGTDRLTRAYPKLPRQLRKCAAYILEHPIEVATLPMRRVAANADVPPSTLQRLARALDFSTYDQFRSLYRDTINRFSEGVSIKAGHLQEVAAGAPMDHAINAFQQTALGNIRTLFDHIDRDVLERAVTALTDARTVIVVGMHSSHAFANYLHYLAAMGFRNWRLLVRHNGELSYLVEALTPEDVLVAISIEPSSAGTIEVARRAREAGARVIGITDRRTSPLASRSDDLLLIPIQSPSFFQSYVGVAVLAEMLAGMIVARGGQSVVDNIDNLERCRREMGEYWQE